MDPEHSPPLSPISAHFPQSPQSPLKIPTDLPTSLDDRRRFDMFVGETEMYDAWQGSTQYLSAPAPSRALAFDLRLDTPAYDDNDTFNRIQDNEARFSEMIAVQARNRDGGSPGGDEDEIATNDKMSTQQKQELLQKSLNMAASNGDVARVRKLVGGIAKQYVNVNTPDEEGTVPLIYASCFGHEEVVAVLLDAGAVVDMQDRNQWSALMWATTNRHKAIAKLLLDHGADPDIRSSSGGTAFDFVPPGSDFSNYLQENGYSIGTTSMGDDFYDAGYSQDRFEEELAEQEVKRRMLMQESAANLEVDLSTLGFDEQPESPTELDAEEEEEFVWDKCIGDQMFVFQDGQLDPIFDLIITNMTPQRSPSQKPVPANLIFLMSRYAHYHMTPTLLEEVLTKAMDRINDVVERYQWDMTMLAFWISNLTLLLHYLKKDSGLVQSTTKYQLELAELINETFILIIRDAERRMNKVIDDAMLDHETIPGLDDIAFQGEWKVFKSKPKAKEEPPEKRFRPPSPKRRAQTSPRNITSLLSSTLFVLDLYDVHSVIIAQILAQLIYWIGAELFNRVIVNRRYLSRTKAMQIRMNVSSIEDWARSNNRQPEHYENGSTISTGETTVDAARRHLAPIIQLLQWLQCFSSLGEDHNSLMETLVQLQRLTPTQLIHAVKNYRAEVGEKSLPKSHMKFLIQLQRGEQSLIRRPLTPVPSTGPQSRSDTPNPPSQEVPLAASTVTPTTKELQSPSSPNFQKTPDKSSTSSRPTSLQPPAPIFSSPTDPQDLDPPNRNKLLLDQSLMLPFSLPTSTDMLISYGAGIGGMNRERARKYIPTVPTEMLSKLSIDEDEDGTNGARRNRRNPSISTVAGAGIGWRG